MEANLGSDGLPKRIQPIPPERQSYLAEVSSAVRDYHRNASIDAERVRLIQQLEAASTMMKKSGKTTASEDIDKEIASLRELVDKTVWDKIEEHRKRSDSYNSGNSSYKVRGKEIPVETTTKRLKPMLMRPPFKGLSTCG